MNLLLFGPPGAGKGTQSALLVKNRGMSHISTGDLLRAAIRDGTQNGKKAKDFMDQGKLVPDEVVLGMVEDALQSLGGKPFILDGFPRTVNQAEALKKILDKMSIKLHAAIFLDVAKSDLLARLTGRRVCSSCGAVYHVLTKQPAKEGACDVCGGSVVQRSDDSEAVVKQRLSAYEESTLPLRDYYAANGQLRSVNGLGSVEQIYEQIHQILS